MADVTAARLRELLHYDPTTGVFTWKVKRRSGLPGAVAGNLDGGYIRIGVDGRNYLGHRLAWLYVNGEWPTGDLDHVDTVGTHNWIANLRPATNSQNSANVKPPRTNTSGYKGVYFRKDLGRWLASIKISGKSIYLGLFDTPEQAQAAYIEKARMLFGEFARAS